MLQAMTWASPPALRMPSATSRHASALRLEITTLAPSCASSSAEERPMPRLEPVMTATWPVRSNGVPFTACAPFCCLGFLHPPAMPGLDPGIHDFLGGQDVDGRDKPGHDDHHVASTSRFTKSRSLTPARRPR